jgi:dethiobiotin synthetase
MEVLEVTLAQLFQLIGLKRTFCVIHYPQWERRRNFDQHQNLIYSEVFLPVLKQLGFQLKVFLSPIVGSDIAEDYVINQIGALNLPYLELYSQGVKVNAWELENTPNPLFWLHQLKEEAPGLPQNLLDGIFQRNIYDHSRAIKVYVSGEKSSVGKSTVCLAILASLIERGVPPEFLAYIKPVTQCELEQPITQYCRLKGIENVSVGPVVFYQGFTRSYLQKETESSAELLAKAVNAVDAISIGKKFVLIDGVGYPSVGSICNISNGHVAQALNVPVLLVGKSGVGDAVDSYNLNSIFFESFQVPVLGGIFNKFELDGFYGLALCKESITMYFRQYKPNQMPYGFFPKLSFQLSKYNE